MPEKSVKLFVKDARYYPEQKSLLIVGEEVETKRPVTQQVLVKALIEAYGIPVRDDDVEAWRYFAECLRKRKDPFTLVFDGTKTEQDPI